MSKVNKPVNLRDLGGLPTADGRKTQHARLLRAGEIVGLSPEEQQKMLDDYLLRMIIDFRGDAEVMDAPDDIWGDIVYKQIDICKDIHSNGADKTSLENINSAMIDEYMASLYRNMVLNEVSRQGFREFISLLLEQKEGATLFHCYAGKDRTGMGAAIILTLLGVSREDIFADYLQTNVLRAKANHALIEEHRRKGTTEDAIETIRVAMEVKEEYLLAAYETAEKKYGSFMQFIQEGLGITHAHQQELQRLYLIS